MNLFSYLTTPSSHTTHTHHHSIHPLVRPGNSSSSIFIPYGPGVVTASTSGTHTRAWSCPSVLFPLETTQASSSSPPLPSVVSEPSACARHCCKRFPCITSFHPHDNYREKAWLFFLKAFLLQSPFALLLLAHWSGRRLSPLQKAAQEKHWNKLLSYHQGYSVPLFKTNTETKPTLSFLLK